jgi:hypothetical protein
MTATCDVDGKDGKGCIFAIDPGNISAIPYRRGPAGPAGLPPVDSPSLRSMLASSPPATLVDMSTYNIRRSIAQYIPRLIDTER